MADEETKARDWQLIQELGGPARVSEKLKVAIQVVQNWKLRGIPAAVKVTHPELFMPELRRVAKKVRG